MEYALTSGEVKGNTEELLASYNLPSHLLLCEPRQQEELWQPESYGWFLERSNNEFGAEIGAEIGPALTIRVLVVRIKTEIGTNYAIHHKGSAPMTRRLPEGMIPRLMKADSSKPRSSVSTCDFRSGKHYYSQRSAWSRICEIWAGFPPLYNIVLGDIWNVDTFNKIDHSSCWKN